MNKWLISVLCTVLLSAFITLLFPNKRYSSLIKKILAVITLIVIVNPVINFDFGNFSVGVSQEDFGENLTEELLSVTEKMKIDNYEKNCVKIIEESGIYGATVEIEYVVEKSYAIKIQSVKINLEKAVIKTEKQHIDIIGEVKKRISEYLAVTTSQVEIYEREREQ